MNKIAKFGISILLGSAAGATLASFGVPFAASIAIGVIVTAISAVALVRFCVAPKAPQKPQTQPQPAPVPTPEPTKPIAATSSSVPVEEKSIELNERNAKALLYKMSLPFINGKCNVLSVCLLDTIQQCIPNWSLNIEKKDPFFVDQTETDALINIIYRAQLSEIIDFRDGKILMSLEKLFGFTKVYTLDFSDIITKSREIENDEDVKLLFAESHWRLVSPYLDRFSRSIASEKDERLKNVMMHFAKTHLGAWFFPNEDKEASETVIEKMLNIMMASWFFDNIFGSEE
jgi:hypothetical protein